MKVLLNKCYGGFGLSKEACDYLGLTWDKDNDMCGYASHYYANRDDEKLIKCIEELGKQASGRFANLEVVEIPDGSFYIINEYDGYETIYYSSTEIYEE